MFALVLGQCLSMILVLTGVSSSKLAEKGVDLPQLQGLLTYACLAVIFVPVCLVRKYKRDKDSLLNVSKW